MGLPDLGRGCRGDSAVTAMNPIFDVLTLALIVTAGWGFIVSLIKDS